MSASVLIRPLADIAGLAEGGEGNEFCVLSARE